MSITTKDPRFKAALQQLEGADWISVPHAAILLGMNEQTIRGYAVYGKYGALKRGNRYYFPSTEIKRQMGLPGQETLGDLVREVIEHYQIPATSSHGLGCICTDEPIRKIKRMFYAEIRPAERRSITPDPEDPDQTDWEYLPGEWERECDAKSAVRLILQRVMNTL